MKLTFLGAAGEVTGSQHLIETDHVRLLLDCGLFQGHRAESRIKNETLACDPRHLQGVILSHAHIDHCGNLPSLFKHGYRGDIFCTPATADVAAVMLEDSLHIQLEDAEYLRRKLGKDHPSVEPLYDEKDVERTLKALVPLDFREWHELMDGRLKVRFSEAGHILGSAISEIEIREGATWKRIIFTGDLGRRNLPLLRDPELVDGGDVLITESTYGSRLHPPADDIKAHLERILSHAKRVGGRVVIPAFSLGRTQMLVYFLNNLYNEGRLPDLPVFVDSPLSNEITHIYRRHVTAMDSEVAQILRNDHDPFAFPGLRYIQSQGESAGLNHRKGPLVIISASGMCESGRVRHHLRHSLEGEQNTIVLIGYQAENTLGRRLQDRVPRIRMFDREITVRANVESISGLSAHADADDFAWWFEHLAKTGGVGQAFIVHGESEGAQGVAKLLENVSNEPPIIPQYHQSFTV